MNLIQKANELGYNHYVEFTVEELDKLSLKNSNKKIEYCFVKDWLREKYSIHIYIEPVWENIEEAEDINAVPEYIPWVIYDDTKEDDEPIYYKTYEEALEQGLIEALEIINK